MKNCGTCPHQSGCVKVGSSCLDDLNAPLIASKQFPRRMMPYQANEFMAALRAGRTLRRITGGGKFGPAIASLKKFRIHCELYAEWGAEAKRLAAANAKAADKFKGERLRNLTHCKYGHPLSGKNVHLLSNGWRKCLTCQKRREMSPIPPTHEQVKQATAALNAGSTLTLICNGKIGAEHVQPRIFTFRKLKLYRKLNPAFDRFVISATANSNRKAQWRRFHPEKVRAKTIRAEANEFSNIVNMVPDHLPPDMRDDIAQSILVALLEGSLQRDQVKGRVQQFVAAHNRDASKHGIGKYGLRSIDAPVFAEGPTTLGDTISRGLWD